MPFNAEQHFESKIKQGSIKNQSTILRFDTQPFKSKKAEREKGLRRICKDRFNFEDFVKINKMHSSYVQELKGNLSPKAFLDVLYRAELTGAKVKIAGKEGIIVEERKNSLCVIFSSNQMKLYPKRSWDFSLVFDGIEYQFLSENLKTNRKINN
ncbi:uncharacterized protein VICG_01343 [Vittaforma corneae ATCC 50505]|uniref:Uncharacterized protein n=1 Tax=Vittaforma corneae (strain ATCC 50505) TaxID=993615 RepID=L2GM94_VITCO|nr:uncharacterized protein VICG_01343 [Vittaforma corneae ATCC 50505]ELA41595.1 hypothetical protein VICG_01343 [Vittaforma corneae ATCC 50505]